MVMTILEANVDQEKWPALISEYNTAITALEPGLVHTYLIQSRDNPSYWRIVTVWESWDALRKMRASGTAPRGVLIFRAADAEPILSVYEVPAHAAAAG